MWYLDWDLLHELLELSLLRQLLERDLLGLQLLK